MATFALTLINAPGTIIEWHADSLTEALAHWNTPTTQWRSATSTEYLTYLHNRGVLETIIKTSSTP